MEDLDTWGPDAIRIDLKLNLSTLPPGSTTPWLLLTNLAKQVCVRERERERDRERERARERREREREERERRERERERERERD
jgi:hypothetical protein